MFLVRIWLFMDRRERADDNAEHLFKYAIKQNDGIKRLLISQTFNCDTLF